MEHPWETLAIVGLAALTLTGVGAVLSSSIIGASALGGSLASIGSTLFTAEFLGTAGLLLYKTGAGTLDGNDVLMGALSLGPLAAARLLKYTGLGAKLAPKVAKTLTRLDDALAGGRIQKVIHNFEKRLAEKMAKAGKQYEVENAMIDVRRSTGRVVAQEGGDLLKYTEQAAAASLKTASREALESLSKLSKVQVSGGGTAADFLYNGIIKNNFAGARMNNFIRTAEEFIDTKGIDKILIRFGRGGEIGAAWELEAAKILKGQGKTISGFGEEFETTLVNTGKWPGDLIELDNGKKILYEAKGWNWNEGFDLGTILKQNNIMKELVSTGQIDGYKFAFRTQPPQDVIKTFESWGMQQGIHWEVLL